MNTVVRTVGSVIGSQVAVTLLATERIAGTNVPAESGFAAALWLGAGAAAIASLLALAIAPSRPRTEPEPARPAGERAAYPSAS